MKNSRFKNVYILFLSIIVLFAFSAPSYAKKQFVMQLKPITITHPVEFGSITLKSIRLASTIPDVWYAHILGEIINDTPFNTNIHLRVTGTPINNSVADNFTVNLFVHEISPHESVSLDSIKVNSSICDAKENIVYDLKIELIDIYYEGAVELSTDQISSKRTQWLGQAILFNDIVGSDKVFKDYQKRVTADIKQLQGKAMVIMGCYAVMEMRQKQYYWKIVDPETNEIYWYRDYNFDNQEVNDYRPFLLETEMQSRTNAISRLREAVGRQYWPDLMKAPYMRKVGFNHLKTVTLTNVKTDLSGIKIYFYFTDSENVILKWSTAVADFRERNYTADEILQKGFYTESPYEKYPEWSEEVWDNIRGGCVVGGWSKEKCRLAWGAPAKISESLSAYGGIQEIWFYPDGAFLTFENHQLVYAHHYKR